MKNIKDKFFIGVANAKHLLPAVFAFFRKATCKHLFKANEMQPRDENGIVRWQCCKCKEVFSATYGLKILEKGTCDGRWDLPNEFIRAKIESENCR